MEQKLKDKILQEVKESEDEDLLVTLQSVIDTFKDKEEIYVLSKEQEEAIEKSEKDFEEGRTVTHEDVVKKVKKMFE